MGSHENISRQAEETASITLFWPTNDYFQPTNNSRLPESCIKKGWHGNVLPLDWKKQREEIELIKTKDATIGEIGCHNTGTGYGGVIP